MDATALGIARILFEDAGYHTAYLKEIEEALTQSSIRLEQPASGYG